MDRRYVGIDLHRRRSVIYAMDWRSCTRIVARPAAGTRARVLEPAFRDTRNLGCTARF
jgi:hypothetical protein